MNAADLDVLRALANTNPGAKEEFLRTPSLPRPRNRYENLDAARVRESLTSLERAEELLRALPEELHRLYWAILQDNVNRNRFVLANAEYVIHAGTQRQIQAAEQHRQANIALYGAADERIFWAILVQKLDAIQARTLTRAENEDYQELLAMIGPVKKIEYVFFTPKDRTFSTFSAWINTFYDKFFRHIPAGQQIFTAQDVCAITNEILREEPKVQGKGWTAVVDPDGAYASADAKMREISFPGKRSRGLYSRDEVREIIAHELGVHALRSMPFADCPISALSLGLPGYGAFEEGLATAVSCAVTGKFSYPGLLHYVSIGLATFLHKNFRDVFEIQVRLERLTHGVGPSVCFDSVQRAFRGTGILPNNKDLIYLHGNLLVWKFIEDHLDDREELLRMLFEMGKSNPTDETHCFICSRMGGKLSTPFLPTKDKAT